MAPRIPKDPKYYTYRKDVSVPRDVQGARLGFAKGKGYYVNTGPAAPTRKPAAPADQFAPTSAQDIWNTINRVNAGYGTPMTDDQIQQRAQASIDPLIAAITRNVNTRADQSVADIRGTTDSLAKALAATDYAAPYQGAIQGQANVDAALQQSLRGEGTALADDLGKRLAMINDPAVAAAGGALADRGAALGTTELARGGTNLGMLLANAAAAKSYGQKLPGIAGMQGAQGVASVGRTAANTIGDQTGQILGQLPSILNALRGENANLRSNRAQTAASLYGTLTGQNITKATAKAGLVTDQAKLDADYAKANAAYGLDQAKVNETIRHNQASEKVAAKRVAVAAKKAAATAAKGLTASTRSKALKAADLYYYGQAPTTRADGSISKEGIPGVSYGVAVKRLAAGFGLSRKQAMAMADIYFAPGERGRPAKPFDTGALLGNAAGAASALGGFGK